MIRNKNKFFVVFTLVFISTSLIYLALSRDSFAKNGTIINPKEQAEIQLLIKEFIQKEARREIKSPEQIREENKKLLQDANIDFSVRETIKYCASKNINCGPGIIDVDSEITFKEMERIEGSRIKVEAEEHRTWYYGDRTIGEGICPHSFILAEEDGVWEIEKFEDGCEIKARPLTEEEKRLPPSPLLEEMINRQTIYLWRMKEISPEELQYLERMKEIFPEMEIEYEKPKEINLQGKDNIVSLSSSYSYNRSNAGWYGWYYALNPNSDFRYFSLDCTNFISQAIWYGNWPWVGWWPNITSTSVWWYAFNWMGESRTWRIASYWWRFIYNRPRGWLANSFCYLQKGDIVQIDYDRNGYSDHSMIVTYKNGCDVRMSYHTANTRNRSIWSIYNESPNATYSIWRLYDYAN